MTAMTYREAVVRALADELDADPAVILLGEDVGAAGGVFKATEGLFDRFGGRRVRDTPISEQAIVGCALGAATAGLRPVAEIMFADFAGVCFDQIANQLAKYRYQSGGQATVPVTLRMAGGGALGFGAQHSQCVENWFLNVPGLKLCVPGTPDDAYHLLRAAIRSDDPVLVFEHKALYGMSGEVDTERARTPLGSAAVVREGGDVTVVATQLMLRRALDAAEKLAAEGIECDVIDPRTLVPLDMETILDSVVRTARITVVQESPPAGSWGQAVVSEVVEQAFESLDAPPRLVAADALPLAYAKSLEDAVLPGVEQIAAAVRAVATS
jgi:pyruvate dehydrogenase E1 component beta subunit